MCLIKDMCFWELELSSKVHTLGRLLALLDLSSSTTQHPMVLVLSENRLAVFGTGCSCDIRKRTTSSLYSLV